MARNKLDKLPLETNNNLPATRGEDTLSTVIVPSDEVFNLKVDTVKNALADSLVEIASDVDRLSPQMVDAIQRFLDKNGAKYGVIKETNPLSSLLNSLPFQDV